MLNFLNPDFPDQDFPPLENALDDPEGLLAVGGCLSAIRLINAYKNGIFPWFNPGEMILWWSPNPRLVLFPEHLRISRSLAKTIRKQKFAITVDQVFSEVIRACAKPRDYADGTWIGTEMQQAYILLHHQGYAHSIEAWSGNELVGGLYGVALGKVFFGEAMFHTQTDASKVAFAFLVNKLIEWDYQLVDCQVHTPHLVSLGAQEISRQRFRILLDQYCYQQPVAEAWLSR